MYERRELLYAYVLCADEADDFEVFKLSHFIYCGVVARGQVIYARFQLCGLGAQFGYSCVQKFLLSGLRRQEAARSPQNCPNNMSP